jgi:hypothetical protein
MTETTKTITFHTYPLRYGNGNVTEAFQKKEIGFEMEIKDDQSAQRNILTLEQTIDLKSKIEDAITNYYEFMEL